MAAEGTEAYAGFFRALLRAETGGAGAWLSPWRQQAFERFEKTGFPAAKDEEWRYSRLEAAQKYPLFDLPSAQPALSLQDLRPFLFTPDWPRAVFLDGIFQPGVSQGLTQEQGLQAVPVAEAIRTRDPDLRDWLQQDAAAGRSLSELNRAFFKDGIFLKIKPGARPEKPLHVLALFSFSKQEGSVHPRHFILAGQGSHAVLVQSFASLPGRAFFNNTLTGIRLGEKARLDHYVAAQANPRGFHVVRSDARLAAGSDYRAFIFSSASRFFRNEMVADMAGVSAQVRVNGLFLTGGAEHLDQVVRVNHQAPQGVSRQQ